MRISAIVLMLFLGLAANEAAAATGASTRPKASWDDMQTFEYNIGRIAGALQLCRRYSMADEIREIAELTPYGKLGMRKMRSFDGINGCGSVASNAESILGDKSKLMEYMKIKYSCGDENCVER